MPPKICIIGAGGGWSTRMHRPSLVKIQAEGTAEYPAVCDLDAEKAKTYAAALDAEPFTDLDAMIEKHKPDGLVVICRTEAMQQLTAMAAERGIPFICEKPPATDSDTHKRLIDAVGDLPHVVAYNRRHAPYVAKAKEWLAGVKLQTVTSLFTRRGRREPFSGTAVHCIDTVRYLAGGDLVSARIEIAPTENTHNHFISGWTKDGVRVDWLITPDTASAVEHYFVRSVERTVVIAYPQPPMIDVPGYVELHEGNKVVERLTHDDFGLDADDLPGLGGVKAEQALFARVVAGEAKAVSTLQTSLQTQQLREQLENLSDKRQVIEFDA